MPSQAASLGGQLCCLRARRQGRDMSVSGSRQGRARPRQGRASAGRHGRANIPMARCQSSSGRRRVSQPQPADQEEIRSGLLIQMILGWLAPPPPFVKVTGPQSASGLSRPAGWRWLALRRMRQCTGRARRRHLVASSACLRARGQGGACHRRASAANRRPNLSEPSPRCPPPLSQLPCM
jgi:hypothetical protein